MSFFGLMGLAIGGAGRLGVPIIKSIFDYYKEKQEIEKLRIKAQIPQTNCNKQCECKFDPNIQIKSKNNNVIERKEPKKFLFIVFIFVLAVLGAGTELTFQLRYNSLENFHNSLEVLRNTSYEIIGFVIAWILTGGTGIDKISPKR